MSEQSGSESPVFRCADGCGGCLYDACCAVQERKKKYLNRTAFQTHKCQLCASKLGLIELVYKDPITAEDEKSNCKKEENDKAGKRHSNYLNRKQDHHQMRMQQYHHQMTMQLNQENHPLMI
eukprot:15366586-Ditylum_brightwellii.AAC.3